MNQIPAAALQQIAAKVRQEQVQLLPDHQECPLTFQCYLPRSSQTAAIGAVFVTAGGVRRFIPDHSLVEAELSERGRLLRLTYTCCTVEVAGQRLEVLFEDAIVGRLGTILQAPPALCHLTQQGLKTGHGSAGRTKSLLHGRRSSPPLHPAMNTT